MCLPELLAVSHLNLAAEINQLFDINSTLLHSSCQQVLSPDWHVGEASNGCYGDLLTQRWTF